MKNVYKNKEYSATRINRMIWKYIIEKDKSNRQLFVISKTSGNKIKMLRQISTGINKLSKNISD